MEGLLSRIGGGLQKFVNNPLVQGIGGAIAFGANPLVGLLAAPGIRNSRERAELRNEGLRAEVDAIEGRASAIDELQGLLRSDVTGRNRTPDFQLDDVAGEGALPVRNLNRDVRVPTIATPEGRLQAQGLLAEIAPQQTAASLLGSPRERTNTTEQKAIALRQEGQRQGLTGEDLNNFINQGLFSSGDSTLDQLMATLAVEDRIFRNEQQRREQEESEEESRKSFKRQQVAINSGLRESMAAAGLNDELAETSLRTGQFAPVFKQGVGLQAAAKRFFGMDSTEQDELLANFGLFEKSTANLLLDVLPTLEGLDAGTDNRLRQIQSSLANTTAEPGANAKILAQGMREFVNIADIHGFEIDNRERVEGFIETLERGEAILGTSPSKNAEPSVINFEDLP